MNLVIVESPSKTKTIKQYLGQDYNVVATKGHIRDVKDCGVDNLGIDFKNGYKPIYDVIPHQQQTIKMLNSEVNKADKIYLATDPDREGEAISWHLNEVLNINGKEVKRIEFNEITEDAIKNAIKNPRDINISLFESQETRKVLDRIIGYRLSTICKRKLGSVDNSRVSAGRVQSVCLKMIVDREKELLDFKSKNYYEIEANFDGFKAKLMDLSGKKKAQQFDSKEEALEVFNKLGKDFTIKSIEKSVKYDKPFPPFTTSTLIQAALNKHNLSSSKTMAIAQELYEGIEVNGKHVAFITYMRTDSTRISDVFKKQLYFFIKEKFGDEYTGYMREKKLSENSQDAHEAIRPVSLKNNPNDFKSLLTKDQFDIYSLIYNQTVEAMMKDSIEDVKTVTFENNGYLFQASFDKTTFTGYKENRKQDIKNEEFDHSINEVINSIKNELLEKKTEGPHRFTEASLIKEMEQSGIGRPSTYASTISTLRKNKYVTTLKKYFVPTKQGTLVSNYLTDHFSSIINVEYTALMEKTLDEIVTGEKEESKTIEDFYTSFKELIDKEKGNTSFVETGELCPKCGSKMVYKTNKYGRFEACSNYPDCKYIKKDEIKEEIEIECPMCHEGHLVPRVSKIKRQKFYGCSNYPKCKFTISSLSDIKKKD